MSRRTIKTFITAGVLILTAVGMSTPAHAVGSLQDNGDGSFTVSSLAANEVVFICATSVAANVCGVGVNNYLYNTTLDGTYSAGTTVDIPFSSPGPLVAGTYNISIVRISGGIALMASASNVAVGAGGSSSSGASSTPSPVTQEFGRPASGTCDAAQPAGLDWAGVPSGGWANSWSQWMNGGNGGFVCTRTLVYNTTQSHWIIG